MLEGNGNGFGTALGTSMGFCCGTAGALAATADSAVRENKEWHVKQTGFAFEIKWLNFSLLNRTCKGC